MYIYPIINLIDIYFNFYKVYRKRINLFMLDKYEHFKKISKTDGCSFYDSEDRTNLQNVLLKRLQQISTWDELLSNRNLQYMNKAEFAPKMIQIFKKKGFYFIVYERPTGPPLSEPQLIGKMPLDKFYPLFSDLCSFCTELRKRSPLAYILPQWVFINRNSCKIGHFQPFFENCEDTNKHVFMYNLEKSVLVNDNGKASADSDAMGFQKKQSLTFNLGVIAYQLLTGTKATFAETEDQYKIQLAQLQKEAFARLHRITKDQKFSDMISKMLKQDSFECPSLNQISYMSKKKSKQYQPKCLLNPKLQLDIQKFHLVDKPTPTNFLSHRKKYYRPCCNTLQNYEQSDNSTSKQKYLTISTTRTISNQINNSSNKNRSFLPDICPTKPKYQNIDKLSQATMFYRNILRKER